MASKSDVQLTELYERSRSQFPVPACVADAIRHHLLFNNAQLGAGHELSNRSTAVVEKAHNTFMNAHGVGEVALAGATSNLFAMLADSYRRSKRIQPGDEIIILDSSHEANAGPWVRLAEETGALLKWWRVSEAPPFSTSLSDLKKLLSNKTKIVAFPHVSNLLGEVVDVGAAVKMIQAGPAGGETRVVVDGVAYAPHLAIDVKGWGVDWYGFSVYKTWGPHMAALYGSHAAFQDLKEAGPNHYWISGTDVPYKFELGGPAHEGCAGIVALSQYLNHMAAPSSSSSDLDRHTVEAAYATFRKMEAPLQQQLVDCLNAKPDVTIIGPTHANTRNRVATISFVHRTKSSKQLNDEIQTAGFAIRHGHMYAMRLTERLVDKKYARSAGDGVVRISLLHYNTAEEVHRLVSALDKIL
ncbi:MAG: hypothetical protein FRX49_12827 [Trebouxia sp. A1-2]|nr:MAG: hypothetical protein FRX49_12827 [Trebouxia sp. A1-2]